AGAQPPVAGCGPVHGELGAGMDATVASTVLVVAPRPVATPAVHLHDGHPVRGHDDLELLGGQVVGPADAAEHHLAVVGLVVDREDALVPTAPAAPTSPTAPIGEQRHEVAVVAGLAELGSGGLVVEVELRCTGQDRVAPGDDRGPLEAAR